MSALSIVISCSHLMLRVLFFVCLTHNIQYKLNSIVIIKQDSALWTQLLWPY
jgi:hypothetical protein